MAPLLRRLTHPALSGLRMHPGSAFLLFATGVAALVIVLPVAATGTWVGDLQPLLRLPPVPDLGLSPAAGPLRTVDQNRQEALLFAFRLLAGLAALTFVIASISALAIGASRAAQRAPEIAIRRMLGASRRLLAGALVLEGLAVILPAVAAGGPAGWLGAIRARQDWVGGAGPTGMTLPLFVIGLTCALLLGSLLLPLLHAGARRVAERPATPVPLWIPAAQLALSLIALVAGDQLARGGAALLASSPAVSGTLFQLTNPAPPETRAAEYGALLDRLSGDPDVEVASLAGTGTLLGLGPVERVTTDCGLCSEGNLMVPWRPVRVTEQLVSADSFKALGARVVEGRAFAPDDRWGTAPVVMVSENLARRDFQNGEPLGRQIRIRTPGGGSGDPGVWYTVVGVVEDRHPAGLGAATQPAATVYLSVLQHPPVTTELLLRTPAGTAPAALADALRQTLSRHGGSVAVSDAGQMIREEGLRIRWFGDRIRWTGWGMLLLATGGLLALMRGWVRSLRVELGIRRAAGARRQDLAWLLLSQAAMVGLTGAALGAWFGPVVWDTLPEVIAGTPDWSARQVTILALLLAGAAVIGAAVPGWRALRSRPGELLRADAH